MCGITGLFDTRGSGHAVDLALLRRMSEIWRAGAQGISALVATGVYAATAFKML